MSAKRIVFVGPESTGKTTFARDFATRYGTVWVPEFSRDYALAKAGPLGPEDVLPIALGQVAREDSLEPKASRFLFLDTDLVMTKVYAQLYYRLTIPALDALVAARPADLYFVLEPDVPWVADPARDMPHRRGEIRDLVLAALEALGRRYLSVSGDWATRTATVDERLRSF